MRSGKSPDDLLLLAIMVIGNFERALVGFKDQRLVTEGVIHLNALICIVILLTADRLLVPGTAVNQREPVPAHGDDSWRWGRGRPSSRCWSTGQSCAACTCTATALPATPGSVSGLDRTLQPGGLGASSSESELERPSPQGKRAPRIGTEVHLLSCIR
ncbi:MAG: hypothetical protein WB773_25115 [Isosphaeraceae bacterium]